MYMTDVQQAKQGCEEMSPMLGSKKLSPLNSLPPLSPYVDSNAVIEVLGRLGLSKYGEHFTAQEIDMAAFLEMGDGD